MGILRTVEDAKFLIENEKYLSALSLLLIAVAASTEIVYPINKNKKKSIKCPGKKMNESESFPLFLNKRILQILFKSDVKFGYQDKIKSQLMSFDYKGNQVDLGYILYKMYRNKLIHEATLPQNFKFTSEITTPTISISGGNDFKLKLKLEGDNVVLDHSWFKLLIEVVEGAYCNKELFGRHFFDLKLDSSLKDDEYITYLANHYDVFDIGLKDDPIEYIERSRKESMPARYELFKEVILLLTPKVVRQCNDTALSQKFINLCRKEMINLGAVNYLAKYGLMDTDFVLTSKGLNILKDMAGNFEIVEV